MAYSSLFKKDDVRITTKFSTTHKALDLSRGVVRQPIYSGVKLGQGTVSYTATSYKDSTGKLWTNSWVVYIKYDNGMTCRMFHGYVADAVVKKGDRVLPGKQVYRTGNSGNSKGDHLHYTLLNSKGIAINPTPYVINDKEIAPIPQPDPCKEYKERVEFLENTLAIREKELIDLETDYKRILEEKVMYEKQYQEVTTELNELKEGRDDWINRLADILHKLFGSK